ncbi:MAG: Lrp/AsnC family transcriptional regulator [Candidatus Nanohaloarchaea archaeon]|nr:Lrp/AsnC family transcriptional regulator [Candidatus Nanohaloarchaea archaeon]
MPQVQRKGEQQEGKLEFILDEITVQIVETLLDNPKIPYNKKQLAEAADISRDALYRRWKTLIAFGILGSSEVGSGKDYWQLNQDSEIVEAIAKIISEG